MIRTPGVRDQPLGADHLEMVAAIEDARLEVPCVRPRPRLGERERDEVALADAGGVARALLLVRREQDRRRARGLRQRQQRQAARVMPQLLDRVAQRRGRGRKAVAVGKRERHEPALPHPLVEPCRHLVVPVHPLERVAPGQEMAADLSQP
jgi:hypothetical protein